MGLFTQSGLGLSTARLTFDVEMSPLDCFSKVFSEIGDFKVMVPPPFGVKSHRARFYFFASKITDSLNNLGAPKIAQVLLFLVACPVFDLYLRSSNQRVTSS